MRTICFFVADITFKGGIERVMSNLTSSLVNNEELKITIVSQYKSHKEPNYFFNNKITIEYLSTEKFSGNPGSIGRFKNHLFNLLKIRRYFLSHRFDIICAQSFVNVFLLFAAGISLKNVIAVEHVYWGYYNKLIQFVRKNIYNKCKSLVVLTNYDLSYYSKFLSNVFLIPNPIQPNEIKPTYNVNSKRIIAIGRLEEQKGFYELINNLKDTFSKHPDWELVIFGEGNLEFNLLQLIDKLELQNNVKLMGTTPNISTEIRKSSFLVMPSKFEGFGMVLLESMNEGVPCISFNCPAGPKDILGENKYGLLIEDQNFQDFINAIESLIMQSDKRISFSLKAFNRVKDFSSKMIARKWLNLFDIH